jgi:FkbH-like protein
MRATEITDEGNDPFRVAKSLTKQGRQKEALSVIREHMRRHVLDAGDLERAGRMIRKALEDSASSKGPLRVLVLGQVTTTWLTPVLAAVAWGRGGEVIVDEGGYDTVLQDLASRSTRDSGTDVVVLLPWSARLFGRASQREDVVQAELDFWRSAWEQVGRIGARVLQVGYDWVGPGPLGYAQATRRGESIALVDEMNQLLRSHLPPASMFVDLALVSGSMGRSSFYDMRRYFWTKQPFSEDAVRVLAEHLWAGVRALTTGPKKVLVLDLDNTLWGGVVGETTALGVALGDSPDGEAYRNFQHYLKGLAERGVVLAIASKNNQADALEVVEKNPDMVLRLDDFGAYEINWEPKGTTILRLARTLNLGLDSMVFFDDNPAEREQVRQACPEVEVVEVPDDPAEYTRALEQRLYFETAGLTEEDRERTGQYVTERKRRTLEESTLSLDDYLTSLEMRGVVRSIDDADMARVVQFIGKTNQFNLTTRRHSHEAVAAMLSLPRSIGVTLRLADRFGDYGLVAVMLVVPASEASTAEARIDTWLMSCRVIGRTAEQYFLGQIVHRCRSLGFGRLIAEYIPTQKNGLVADLYPGLGFQPLDGPKGHGEATFHALDLHAGDAFRTFVSDMSTANPGGVATGTRDRWGDGR